MKLLLVEDDKVTRDYVISGLRGAGHVVDDIADGVDGLAHAELLEEGEADRLGHDDVLEGRREVLVPRAKAGRRGATRVEDVLVGGAARHRHNLVAGVLGHGVRGRGLITGRGW